MSIINSDPYYSFPGPFKLILSKSLSECESLSMIALVSRDVRLCSYLKLLVIWSCADMKCPYILNGWSSVSSACSFCNQTCSRKIAFWVSNMSRSSSFCSFVGRASSNFPTNFWKFPSRRLMSPNGKYSRNFCHEKPSRFSESNESSKFIFNGLTSKLTHPF